MTNLADYLKTHSIKQSHFANRLGISCSYLSLILSGKRGVDLDLAFLIEKETHGAVTARSFSSIPDGDAVLPLQPPNAENTVSVNEPCAALPRAHR